MGGPTTATGAGVRRLRTSALLGALLALLLLGGATPASAHAALRATDPADGTVLTSAPRHITLTFTESVGLLDDSFRVYDPRNERIGTGEAAHAPGRSDTARVSLPAGLRTGTFTVAWRVVSADSHPVAGAFTFSVGKPSATAPPARGAPVEDPETGRLYVLARYAAYLAVVLLVGTVTFRAVCRPPDAAVLRGPVRAGWWALHAATAVLFVLRAPYEEGTGPASALDLASLSRTASSRPGLALLARLALLLVTGALLSRRPALLGRAYGGPVLAVGLALTWAAAEHASAGIQVPVARAAAVLHLLAAAVWLGGLTALLITLHRAAEPLPATVVTRFSRLAQASVTVLVVTGVYQSWRGLGSWDALTETSYGRLLTLKLAAVVLLLTAAAGSRRWTARPATEGVVEAVRERVPEPVGGPPPVKSPDVPDATPDPVPGARGLRRTVLAEAAVGAVVLLLSTLLTGTLPGRAEAEAASGAVAGAGAGAVSGIPAASVTTVPFEAGTARGKAQITLDPGRVGKNSVQAVVYGRDGGFATVPELRVSYTLPARALGPIDARVADQGGYWGAGALNLPMAGTWTMKVTVRVSELDQVSVTKRVRIAP
ncbi:copper resistance protein CopC [Streptomyces sp. V3I7]|uniref:copper resistance CopC/CopD family protein n=1 Tax=Streptomyces sp. V3I7 TaxID=3042278 RepID=UPI0027D8A46D|nr:copper resistance protein CopC [Streptomyces sp. V3I7]